MNKTFLIKLLIIFPFETVNPLRKKETQKDFSLCKSFKWFTVFFIMQSASSLFVYVSGPFLSG